LQAGPRSARRRRPA